MPSPQPTSTFSALPRGQAALNGCARRSTRTQPDSDGRPRIRRMPTDRARVRFHLLRRDAPPAGRPAQRDFRAVRAGPSDRRRRRRRTPGGCEARRARPDARSALPDPRARRDRPGDRRRRGRGRPLSDPARRVRRPRRRRRDGRARARLRHLRRHGAVQPARRRLDRPSRARRLRDERPVARRGAGRRPGCRAPAHEHSPRPERGRRGRARLSPGGGPYALRLQTRERTARRPRGAARRVRGRARPRLARARPHSRAVARPPQRRVRPRHGRRLPPPPGAHRCRAGDRPRGAPVTASLGEGLGARAQPRAEHRMSGARVAVVGAGLAGIAAALELADSGADVTLFEARSRLGGATYSVQRNDHWIDNGQHVLLRCCTAYRAFLAQLGVEHLVPIQPRLRIPILREGKPPAFLHRAPLPAPLHLVPTLLRYALLDRRERAGALRASAALRKLDPGDTALDERTFGDWLRDHGQSEAALAELWDLITVPTLNLPAAEASLAL